MSEHAVSPPERIRPYARLTALVSAVLAQWPEHAVFVDKRFAVVDEAHLAHADALAALVLRVCGDRLAGCCADYRTLCARLLREELHFRRHHRYRHDTVAAVRAELARDPYFAGGYMNGLLLSQPLWTNHVEVARHYAEVFLPGAPADYRHLEVGPGHGLLLFLAARDPRCAEVVGWDASPASLAATEATLCALDVASRVHLERRDVAADPTAAGPFDQVVVSELLEHLEHPEQTLRQLAATLAPGGRLFVNMPINSPAPDHVYLLRTPEAVVDLVRAAGLAVDGSHAFPASGYSEAQARRQQLTMSVVVIARRRGRRRRAR